MIKVLYAGDAGALVGPLFIPSPFTMEIKNFQMHVWGQPLIDGLQSDPEIKVTHMTAWDAYSKFPKTPEELAQYDVVMLCEVETDTLYFYPEFYTPSMWKGPITGPNRLKSIKQYIEKGGGFVMTGGWLTFQGRFGHGRWHGTPVEEAFPMEFMPDDDRVEAPEGAYAKALNKNHPVMKGVPWEKCPPFLGYNRAKLKEGATLLATIGEKKDPLIALWDYGKGRALAFASDATPHWAVNFIRWEHYSRFWIQVIKWLAKKL